jgi:endonuclease/exonuclease/phosphatase (EEP) superfamily protein YafD
MSTLYATTSFLVWMAVLSSCVDMPQIPARPVTDPSDPDLSGESATGAPSSLRLGAWNLRKFGFDTQKDTRTLSATIKTHFDLVALLEVVWSPNEQALAELASALAPEFGLAHTATPRPNLSSPHSEYYVVAYRRALVAPCPTLSELTFFADGDGSDSSPTRGVFLREPAFACYRALDRVHGFDFLLAVYHAHWGEGDARDIASEVSQVDRVFAAMQEALPGERALYMIGDFNLTPGELAPLTRARDRSAGQGSTLDAQGNITRNLYDHLLAFGAAANAALSEDARVLDVRSEAFDLRTFRERVSDHLPIVAQLRLSEDDD